MDGVSVGVLTFEEFVYREEWLEIVRLSQFVSDGHIRERALKLIREHKRGKRPLFKGPYGEQSGWAGICRAQY